MIASQYRSHPFPLRDEGGEAPLVFSEDRARVLAQSILSMTSADTTRVLLTHRNKQIVRITNNQILSLDDGDTLTITVVLGVGLKGTIGVETNQVDETTLRDMVARAESLARAQRGWEWHPNPIPTGKQQYTPVALWRAPTAGAMHDPPDVVQGLVDPIRTAGFQAAGFVGLMARSGCVVNRDGVDGFYQETDCECTATARSSDGTASGWHGQANRDWAKIDVGLVSRTALAMGQRSVGMRALEPGRRTAILGPAAVAQLVGAMAYAYDAYSTDNQMTPFYSQQRRRNKLGERVFDPQITLSSDPADPEGGYCPYFPWYGLPTPSMTWVDQGVLRNLSYSPGYAMQKGKPFAVTPNSLRMVGTGTITPIEQMIAQCQEGVYVNRFSAIDLVSPLNGMMTGVTRDGCFFVKDGRIDRPVKNFRFVDSPWFFLNRVRAIGPSARAPFGFAPPVSGADNNGPGAWPRPPMIVPPLMVDDFNFSAMADAV
jgi:predicted Zn-dependent protease